MTATATPVDVQTDDFEPVGPRVDAGGAEEWLTDARGRDYVPRRDGRQGIIARQGSETVEQARERDGKPKPPRPKRTKKPKLPEPPKGVDLKLIEKELEQALKAPAAIFMVMGEEWPAQHVDICAPGVARNLVLAAEHNPWLRRQLEEIATGQAAMGKIISITSLAGSTFIYVVPLLVYFGLLPVPQRARAMLGDIPYRNHPRQDAPAAPTATDTAETPDGSYGA